MSAGPILSAAGVVKRLGGISAVDGVTLAVEPGSITALIGPNGAGKTTLFHCVTGFLRPDSGEITFAGGRIDRCAPHTIARRGLVRTFQITKTLARMTVLDNMVVAAPGQPGERLSRLLAPWPGVRAHERAATERARELLALVRLERYAGDYAGALSVGQRKLLEFARALMTRPRMLMLDEPMAGVNPALGQQLLEHLARLRTERDMTFLFVEHDMDVVMSVSDRVIVMNEGRVISAGIPREIRGDPAVIDAYLGAHADRDIR